MTDSDRALLEAAARAAGIKALRDPFGQLRNCDGFDPMMNMLAAPLWNPLTDDGDALRLAVRLGIDLYIRVGGGCTAIYHEIIAQEHAEDGDYDAATRRAITRAAASMDGRKG